MAVKQSPDALRRERAARNERKGDTAFLIERKRIQVANEEKTVRLRTLRLAKEAADREVAAKAAAELAANPPPKKTKKRAAVAAPVAAD